MQKRIVLIGAGSSNFGLGTIGDIFKSKVLEGSTIVLHDINTESLKNSESIANNYKNKLSSNVACTILKIQEKKTQKGNSYAIVKFSDLSGTFELFIFSDIFENNRDLLKEGNSIMITLIKNFVDESKSQKKINVKKIVSLKHVLDKPIDKINF